MRGIVIIVVVIVIVAALGVYYVTRPPAAPSKKVKIAVAYLAAVVEPFDAVHHEAMLKAEKELGVIYDYTETNYSDVERVLRGYAAEDYDLIWGHGFIGDSIFTVAEANPNERFMHGHGPGAQTTANLGNFLCTFLEDATYLEGIIAGMMTKTNKIGVVAAMEEATTNMAMNGFIKGVLDVNKDAKIYLSYLQSWYDPPKATEYAKAQIALGADIMYADRHGVIEAMVEKHVYGFGMMIDQHSDGPDVVLTSAVMNTYPIMEDQVKMIIEGTWTAKEYTYGLKEGFSDIAPYYDLEAVIPVEARNRVTETRQKMLDGTFKVTPDIRPPREVWGDVIISA